MGIATSAALQAPAQPVPRTPGALLVWAIVLGGCAAAAGAFTLALTSEAVRGELGEPLVIAFLGNWITLSYVLGGLLAWSRRPESRFGPLMIAAGFVNFVVTLSWTTNDATFTLGQALDMVPPVLFLHVFIAYPTGRLDGTFERWLVAVAYATAIGLQLVRMASGGFGPHNLLEVASNPRAGLAAVRVQLFAVGVCCLLGVAILAARRLRAGRPLRRSFALLVDAFALGLVMVAALFLSLVFGGPATNSCGGRRSRRSASLPSPSWSGSCTTGSHVRRSASSCSSCAPILPRASFETAWRARSGIPR